jgi:fructoselysine-6-P-deglycase FrlB-like protein
MAPSAADTAAALEAKKAELAQAEADNQAALDEAEANRSPLDLLGELLTLIVSRHGNHPELVALVERYKAKVHAAEGSND